MIPRHLRSSARLGLLAALLALVVPDSAVRAQAVAQGQGESTAGTPARQSQAERAREKRKKQADADDEETDARRPYRAVFGGAGTRTDLTRTLDFNGSVTEAYDQNRLADSTSPDGSRLANSDGFYSGLVGDLAFRRKGNRLEAVVNGGASARYYSDLNQFLGTDYHIGAGLSARLSARTQIRVDQAFSYAPVDLLGVFVSALPPTLGAVQTPSTDFAVNDNRSYANSTSGQVSRRMGPRSDITLSASTRLMHYLADPTGNSQFRELGGGGVYAYRLNTGVSLRLGYGYRGAQYRGSTGNASSPGEHSIDVGLDVRRMLSESRRVSFALRTGSAVVQAPTPTNTQASAAQLRLLVDASLAHQMGETWQIVGSYRRGSDLVEGLAAPVFSDAWTFTTNGFFSRHVDFTSALAYSTGEPSLATVSQNFTTYTGNARVRVALGHRWATTAEYLYYFYDFSKTPQLSVGYVPRFSRNTARVGLSLWLPLGRR
jgi:hypothetical protein